MDIISKEGDLLLKATLIDKVRSFSRVKIKTKSVKVPKLKARRIQKKFKQPEDKQIPTSAIVNILIKTALDKAKREKKDKPILEDDKSYTPIKEEKPSIFGGYGTVSRTYGTAPISSYVDYGKLFSYLGKFRAKSAYENLDGPVGFLNKSLESGSFVLADKEPIEKASRYIKYFLGGLDLNPLAGVNPLSMVPVAGMSAAEWREYKMWMQLDSVMYLLKSRIA